ncbi:DUF6602 domain-containing protein [Ferrovum sp.]|uniref:DUF6602 domain-containing protein n=1 Tax=Ferrovum sp. TaxID=2609467 RepID=UPI00344C925B
MPVYAKSLVYTDRLQSRLHRSVRADAASVFANTTDIGMSRELAYAEFIKQHAPSKCDVFLGGYLFDDDGAESKQLDIIITTDTHPISISITKDGTGKSFSPVEGTLGVVSVKSTLFPSSKRRMNCYLCARSGGMMGWAASQKPYSRSTRQTRTRNARYQSFARC